MMIGIDMGHKINENDNFAINTLKEDIIISKEVGTRVIRYLEALGEIVINCTVDDSDNNLYDTISIANRYPLDLFISINLNKVDYNEMETYILYYGVKSEVYARRIQESVCKSCNFINNGIRIGDFYLLRNTKAPAALINIFLENYIGIEEKIAKAIVRGITNKNIEE